MVIGSESSGDVISDVLDDTSSATGGAHSSSVTVQVSMCSYMMVYVA